MSAMSPRSVTNCPPVELCLPFRRALFAAVRAGGERPALVTFERVLSCRALGRKPDRVRDALLRSGLGPDPGPGAVVSLALPHGWAWAVALSAVLRCGAVLAPATARPPPSQPAHRRRDHGPHPGGVRRAPDPAAPGPHRHDRAPAPGAAGRAPPGACAPPLPWRVRAARCGRAGPAPPARERTRGRPPDAAAPAGRDNGVGQAGPRRGRPPSLDRPRSRRTPGNPWGRPSRRPAVPVFRRAAASPARTPTTAAARPPSGTV
ncbi:AMP-binding protein [Streptomyces sp. Tu 6176]|uniref:AMP-binding protein n=1 Tax=Streptomyces sp. Tu 6176 TaxID=1470557 RepID=UPI000D11FBCE